MAKYIVVGGGPVGCLAALQLAKNGHQVTVYEGRSEIPNDPEQSYPIGVNPRGLHAIASAAPEVTARIRNDARVIDSIEIFAGQKLVAKLPSGLTYGTSRGNVNLFLWEVCSKQPEKITLVKNHRLHSMDFTAKTLTFDVLEDGNVAQQVTVDASDSRIVGADGVHSAVRRSMEAADPTFKVTVTPWVNQYRVLFGGIGQLNDDMDVGINYLFSSGYFAATIDNSGQLQWTLSTMVRSADPPSSLSQVVKETEATPENIDKLKRWIETIAPRFLPLVPDDEWAKYFTRRSYSGAVVECSRFNHGEWIVLLGDAAHALLPPTAEGINSGLDDALVLGECTAQGVDGSFERYNTTRYPDIQAILVYAKHLNQAPSFAGERIARILFRMIESSSNDSIAKSLFGPLSENRWPYRKIVESWQWRRAVWLNLSRVLAYPLAAIGTIVMLPASCFKAAKSTKAKEV
ncbi:hypothetical protein LEN26_020012 [Aphanomyces euteiches]|nr:hypothetical protein LEN26_020012 [Aphanomyces euteiches]KAH9102323.1 hypothetical protein AeMF1_021103 [Aphanomyces euteiches]KAH9189607.1 hypothetical protein AeNC1_008418 [Aphanomyces euteiches]